MYLFYNSTVDILLNRIRNIDHNLKVRTKMSCINFVNKFQRVRNNN